MERDRGRSHSDESETSPGAGDENYAELVLAHFGKLKEAYEVGESENDLFGKPDAIL